MREPFDREKLSKKDESTKVSIHKENEEKKRFTKGKMCLWLLVYMTCICSVELK